jgi:protein polybromo-1
MEMCVLIIVILCEQKGTGKKLVTGYILYSSDVRKTVAGKFPESSFGEISRIVGNEVRNVTF